MGNSIYVQISPYLLLEYTYGDSSSTYVSSQVKLARIQNAYLDDQCQFINTSPSELVTQNVLDTSAANLGGYKWVLLDKDVPAPYIYTDPKLTYTDMSSLLTSLYVVYDSVKVHFVSGYRLEDLEGIIIQLYSREALTSKYSILANNVYLNSDSRDVLNPKPILLGDRIYDRYVELLIPSVKYINDAFFLNATNPISIGYQYTSDNSGLLFNTAIYVKVYEINKLEKKNGITFMYTADNYEVNINQEDTYSSLAANIREASDGDYFEYFPTYQGNFILDFIENLNAEGGDYVIINDIDVYEQVGMDNILTSSFSQFQTGGYDTALEFRPIIKYAGSAVAFSIDYTVRIYNRQNGFQLIRRSSVTSFLPKKYGKQLEKIKLAAQSYPFKVYNKIYSNSPVSFIGNEFTTSFNTVYVPVFYDSRSIVVQNKTLLANGSNPISPDFYKQINFGQGDAMIYLSDFESYHKFVVSQVDAKTKSIMPIDLTSGNVAICFKDSAGNILKFPAETSDPLNSLTQGEVVFKLPDYLKKKVLFNDLTQSFFIVTESSGAPETLLYSGFIDKIENINKEHIRASEIVNKATTLSNTKDIVDITTKTTTEKAASPLSSTTVQIGKEQSLAQHLTQTNSVSLETVKNVPEVKPPVIPNYNFDLGSASIKNSLKPASSIKTKISTDLVKRGGSSTDIETK